MKLKTKAELLDYSYRITILSIIMQYTGNRKTKPTVAKRCTNV